MVFKDMSSAYEQLRLANSSSRKYGTSFVYENKLYNVVYTTAPFGANLNPWFLKIFPRQEMKIEALVLKAGLLFFDDNPMILDVRLPRHVLHGSLEFCGWIWDKAGWVFSEIKSRMCPSPVCKVFGYNVVLSSGVLAPMSDKVRDLFDLCDQIVSASCLSLRELSRVNSKFRYLAGKFGKVLSSRVNTLIKRKLVNSDKLLTQEAVNEFWDDQFLLPSEIFKVFCSWFEHLFEEVSSCREASSNEQFELTLWLVNDASNVGVGMHALFVSHSGKFKTEKIASNFLEYPDDLKSLILDPDNQLTQSSVLREKWAAISSLKWLQQMGLPEISEPSAVAFNVCIQTDSLNFAWEVLKQKSTNPRGARLLTEFFDLTKNLGVKWEVIWKSRWRPSSISADLGSRLVPWRLTDFARITLQETFTNFDLDEMICPWRPVEMAQWSEIDVPKRIWEFHSQSRPLLVFLTPNISEHIYNIIIQCLKKFTLEGLIISPHLYNTQFFRRHLMDLHPQVLLPTSSLFFNAQDMNLFSFQFNYFCAQFSFN
jgi:hypothetical protein